MRLIMLCLMLLSFSAAAQVYTYIDAEGNRVFTDKPRAGNAKRVELPTTNTMPVPGQTRAPVTKVEKPAEPQVHYQLLRILVPQPDATIRSNNGDLIVSATSEPTLQQGHRYRLLLDGNVTGEAGTSPVFPLENLDRGTHQLSVEIIDEQDRTVERTPNQPVHILRTSLAQRRMAKPCQLPEYGVRPECPIDEKPEEPDIPFVPFI
ncbi:Penicillin-binding protein [Pseudomonas marincola]|uniref:Penicillin-binding protein n=1 Tax=Pseudomonas marincola TaxID=437900 RepID=A0A1I7A9V2_9PSED|nr:MULTISPECIES: DUF4124 domain-containing protein [Pseudomonas]NRH27787.1 DUF4124 domain-containing protein [Pseudomonas sp. MS19]OEO27478.1 penicillin-binding protein [Pseudomonas sp. J237]CAE6949753.1 Penicillin-binding protein [Pseudomonas marincola]SFT71687.1 protein of unknown function [Pseudomonas marincola]